MNWSQDVFVAALNYASDAHIGQLVPGTERPYDTHLTKVAMEVMAALQLQPELNGNLALQCALLHDSVEDTDRSIADIEENFGADVAHGVSALTKDKNLPKPDQMSDSLNRILACPPEVAAVKLADRITNLAPPPVHWSREKCQTYRKEAQLILLRLGHASPPLAARLAQRIDAYAQWC